MHHAPFFGSVLFVFLLFACFVGCQKESTASLNNRAYLATTKSDNPSSSFNVTLCNAKNYIRLTRNTDNFSIIPLAKDCDTLLYICNLDNGWLIVSGDKRTFPVLASDESGSLDLSKAPDGILVWLDTLAEDLWHFKQESIETENDNTLVWSLFDNKTTNTPKTKGDIVEKWYAINYYNYQESVDTITTPHLTTTEWGQSYPWNSKCPIDTSNGVRCYLGCCPVAVAQLLYFTHYNLSKPNSLYHVISCSKSTVNGKTSNIGFSRSSPHCNSLRWNDMSLTRYGLSTGVSYVGDLILDIGNRFATKYSGSGSSADIMASELYNHFELSYLSGNYDYSLVNSSIINGMPVVVSAFSERGFLGLWYSGGHEWLIDGKGTTTTTYHYTKAFEYSENWTQYSEIYDSFDEIQSVYGITDPTDTIEYTTSVSSSFWLMNWGYDGDYNPGHYGVYLTSEWNPNGFSFQYERKIYYNFH